MSKETPVQAHSLLRGGRWHLARARSRALWTSATTCEVGALVSSTVLRQRVEDFLRRASAVLEDLNTLMVLDEECSNVAVVVTLPSAPGSKCTWDWVVGSRGEPAS